MYSKVSSWMAGGDQVVIYVLGFVADVTFGTFADPGGEVLVLDGAIGELVGVAA